MSRGNGVSTRPASVAEWGKKGQHDVVLPSGAEVTIVIPNLPKMIKSGQVPNDLLDAALGVLQGNQKITKDLIQDQSDFFHLMVSMMVKDPKVTVEDLDNELVPYEDIELLVELGTRQRDVDALGNHIAGLHKSAEWRKFRGIEDSSTNVAGL